MRRARGAEVLLRMVLRRKRWWEWVRSERVAVRKVRVARRRPIMVRYWKCQP
jgi:hypothetical protein